ncbi:MAG: amino acid adenylation domain-containing protein, partial [Chthoniobacterales bacterium]
SLSSEFPRIDIAPTTEAQREIWASAQMGDDANCAYNESNIISLKGSLDRSALEKALLHVIQRHSALRSTFSEDGEQQRVQPAPEYFELPLTDISSQSAENKASDYTALRTTESSHAFDLVHGPLLRLQLIALEKNHHVLLFTAHHMICDGWSFGMIVDELSKSYNAFRSGRVPMLPPPMPFGDYARRLALESVEKESARDYWISQFSNGAPTLELPTDRSRPPLKSYSGAMQTRVLNAERFARLKKAAPQLGGTLFVNLLSTFATFLHRFSGQEDLVIGIPSAGQTLVGCDELVGHCLNFLPLRLHCAGNESFKSLTESLRKSVIDAYEHQNYTFGSLVRALKLPRDTSRLPLVSVMFNIDKSGFDHLHFDDLTFHVTTNAKQFVNFDLFFNLVQSETQLEVECEYNTDLYDAATIQRWLASFEELIESILSSGDTPLSELPILSDVEKQTLATWNTTAHDYSRDAAVHTLVAEVGRAHSKKTAVLCGDTAISYEELERRANQLAAHLCSLGVKSGDLVGLFLERSAEMVIGLLGILKAGAAYVPMDPSFPKERLQFMMEDAHMPVIVSQSALLEAIPSSRAHVVTLDMPFTESSAAFIPKETGGEHPAYVIFTSGSTGRPKGVVVSHRSLVNFLTSMRREPGMKEEDILLSVTTLSFDISGLEILLPLTTGATVAIAARETLIDGTLLRREFERTGATIMQATPSTWRLLLEAEWTGNKDLKILIGGEAVPRELVNQLTPCCASLWNVYGPTESTIWSVTTQLKEQDRAVTIGKPIANTQVHVVNPSLQLQPIGVPGELLIGGDGLALGYHERPELTAERFIPDIFNDKPNARLYRTGDIGFWNASALLECQGRLDHQIKLRGYRIEAGEIEAQLEKHPDIAEAIVCMHGQRLIAYLRMNGVSPLIEESLRLHLARTLPDYMIPTIFVKTDSFPLTPNGKVDRNSLPAPEPGNSATIRAYTAPTNNAEQLLADIWQEVLSIPRVGIHDDIFEIGADSILIFQIIARANRAGLKLSPAQLFQQRTIASLALVGKEEKTAAPLATIKRLDRDAYRRK